jgi:hypothetical protein
MQMNFKWVFTITIAIGIISSCNSGKSKTNDIATDMCGCFNMLKDSLPAEGLKVFEKTASSSNPQETFTKEMKNLNPSVAQKINSSLMSTAKPGSAINNCLKELDKKYKTNQTNQQEMAKKMIDDLKDTKGCDIMLALMRMNLKK